ncbi:hypothetical protein C8F01DRAFT_226845 [Mycena amicta]|nr:hypothetical protein C8F01DRAFT_226845 [Mycena amicta]
MARVPQLRRHSVVRVPQPRHRWVVLLLAPFKMPAAPTAFAGFGNLAPTTTKPNGTVDAPSVPPTTAFTFGGSASTSKPSVFTPPATSLFSSSSTTTTPSAFSFASPPTTAFGSSGASSTTAAPFGSAGSPSPFGGSKPTSSFLSNSASSGTGFTFGASLGNPVGFSFGSPKGGSSTPADTKSEGSGAEDGDGDETEAVTSQETEKTSTEGSKKTSSFFTSDVPSTMDAEGEGEEDEETVQAARIKAFRMKKKDEPGDTPWIDMGIGFVRLKKHKETAARRLLLRNSHSGKIQINFALFSGFSATLKSKTLLFVGHDDAANSQTYNLKFKTDADALDFQDCIGQGGRSD